ncbi:MAG: peptidyl-prolyl cis-trans isomerase [Candidatus Accumulibacter sp.]|uniref:peptidylprolyl isomerase n=1 Tax=Accumulibacter sp. TaxID=2053492 RepID=UPI001E19BE07|nr:peptidylprolyl isomerase [Accumulibacter sp.]MCB1940903.1 peptidyl-prolyl cis-trans isomerase [Accumulibacter sp.]
MTPDRALPGNAQRSPWRGWLREPLLHFLLIGGALFAAYAALNPSTNVPAQSNQIRLTRDELRQLAAVWAAKWQRPPTPEEMNSLVENRIRDEVLYRESLALGLDQNDTIVRRRLAQKMEFLAEDTSAIRDPAEAELRAWFEQNRASFALPGRISFRHVYFSPDQRRQAAREAAGKALTTLAGKPADWPTTANIGDRFMFQDQYAESTPEQLAGVFGTSFAQALSGLQAGVWQGPIESGLGWHLVFIDSITRQRLPIFDEVEAEVKAAWINAQRAEEKRKLFAAMRARYEVVLPPPDATDAATAAAASTANSR